MRPSRFRAKVLQPGTYVFQLGPTQSSRNILQVFDKDGRELLATMMTVPKKRQDPKGDVVLTFGAAPSGHAPALQAYFYPGTIYGHELVYSDEEARDLAKRYRTLVLAQDRKGTDMEKATLRVFNDRGESRDYIAGRPVVAAGDDRDERRASTAAPLIMTDRQARQVSLDEFEENPARFLKQRVSIDAEVENVLGPRLFTIAEANWADLDGEVLVFAPSFLATLVAEDDRVTVSGTMKPYNRAELECEWGWISGVDDQDMSRRAILMADRIVGGDEDLAPEDRLRSQAGRHERREFGQRHASRRRAAAVTDVVAATDAAVGRSVSLDSVTVDLVETGGGFWVRDTQGYRAFVLPSDRDSHKLTAGQRVSIDGVLLSMPREMRSRLARDAGPT